MKFIQQLFSQNYIKFQTHEVIFYSSFTLIIAGLAVAFFFGYVTWETSDSIVQNTDLLTLKKFWCRVRWTTTECIEFIAKCELITESKVGNFNVEI